MKNLSLSDRALMRSARAEVAGAPKAGWGRASRTRSSCFSARYGGFCGRCGLAIRVGQDVRFHKNFDGVVHDGCRPPVVTTRTITAVSPQSRAGSAESRRQPQLCAECHRGTGQVDVSNVLPPHPWHLLSEVSHVKGAREAMIGEPRPEDLEQADWLERRAALTVDPEELAGLRWVVGVLRSPVTHWPVEDAPRDSEYMRHEVLDELGDLRAYDPRTDSYVLLPVRVALKVGDPEVHIGPYDLGQKDISVLRRALASYERFHAQMYPRQVR